MKKLVVLVLVAIVIGLIGWHFFSGASRLEQRQNEAGISTGATTSGGLAKSGTGSSQVESVSGSTSPAAQANPQNIRGSAGKPATNPAALPYQLGSASAPPAMDPQTVLGNARIAIVNYGSRFGGNPVGTNPEITAALNGDNPQQVKFLNAEAGHRINGQGELVDAWGTPFFFHQISGTEMEIRSAGPDRKMYTPDDLVTK